MSEGRFTFPGTEAGITRRSVLTGLAVAAAWGGAAVYRVNNPVATDAHSVAVVAKGYASPFWDAVRRGSMQAGTDLGVAVSFNGPDNESDVNRQVDQLNMAFVRNPSALAFAALDSAASAAPLLQFEDANIPVVAFDSGVPGSDVPLTTVATDNRAAAAEAAARMDDLLGGSGKVAVVCHSQTSVTGTDRRDGFTRYLAKRAPGIAVVDVQYNDSDQARAESQASAIMQAHPDLGGLYATDDDGAVAAANAAGRMGRDTVTIIGFDSGRVQIGLIQAGAIRGSITQNPFRMGYLAVQTAIEAVRGTIPPPVIDSGFAWYDKTNMDDPAIAQALYM